MKRPKKTGRKIIKIIPAMVSAGIDVLRDHEDFLGLLGPGSEESLVRKILEACLTASLEENASDQGNP